MTKHTGENPTVKPRKKRGKKGSKKSLIFTLICIAFAGLIIARFASGTHVAAPKKEVKTVAVAGRITDQPATISTRDDKAGYSVDASYPIVAGTGSTAVRGKINSSLKNTADGIARDFKDNVALIAAPSAAVADDSTLSVRYSIKQPVQGIVGVVFDVSEYARGAAHPNDYVVVKNYSLATGGEVVIKDLFKPGTDHLIIISRESVSRLDVLLRSEGMANWFREGARPVTDNYDAWYLSENGLVVIFNPYQVAPYVRGKIEITIPFTSLGSGFVL